ncbi:MAG: carboxypeptidase-like regulatory domain-containing protein, partial [Acidobacteria bacterium]|nr:carboxypeptidase-like regulatory domain-containing protein [Acidobacteriota bacterium]
MSRNRILQAVLCLILVAGLVLPIPAAAQVTTGTLAGTIFAADGAVLPGVTVEATHVPTGTTYQAWTGDNGRYTFPNIRVGGPYT